MFFFLYLGYLAGRMRSAFIRHQDFVSVPFFICAKYSSLAKMEITIEQSYFSLFPVE